METAAFKDFASGGLGGLGEIGVRKTRGLGEARLPAGIHRRCAVERHPPRGQAAGAGSPLGTDAATLYTNFCNSGRSGMDFSGIIKMITDE